LTGIWPLFEVEQHQLRMYGKTRAIVEGRQKRLPVRDYLMKQGRFAHFINDDIDYFQAKIDEMWTKWLIPGVLPFSTDVLNERPPA
jgi:pyruvate ferredoxin oxidoreductase beta subunit